MKRLLLLMVSFLSLSMAFCQNSAKKQKSADSVVWSGYEGYSTVYLYKNELDTTIYPEIDEIEEYKISSYTRSEYAIDGLKAVRAEFLNTMSLLPKKQLDMMLGDYSGNKKIVFIKIVLSKGVITKLEFSFYVPAKGILPDSLIILADKKIRTVKFHDFEGFGIDSIVLNLLIYKKNFTKLCTKSI